MDTSDTILYERFQVLTMFCFCVNCSGLNCVTQFVTLFQISRKTKPAKLDQFSKLSYFCIVDAHASPFNGIVASPIF